MLGASTLVSSWLLQIPNVMFNGSAFQLQSRTIVSLGYRVADPRHSVLNGVFTYLSRAFRFAVFVALILPIVRIAFISIKSRLSHGHLFRLIDRAVLVRRKFVLCLLTARHPNIHVVILVFQYAFIND